MNSTSINLKLQNICESIYTADFSDKNHCHFDVLMDFVMNRLCLVIGETRFRIIEAEVYYKSKEHNDVYTHCDSEQLKQFSWYFNGMGLDITFGREGQIPEENIYGGILIRGIKRLTGETEYISGVSNCLKALFAETQKIDHGKPCFYFIENQEYSVSENYEPVKSSRIGLTKRADDKDDFLTRNYRYLSDLCPEHKFKAKEDVVRNLLVNKKIDNNKAASILGYQLKTN